MAEKLFVPSFSTSRSNFYSKEYVDELQRFYQRERETLKDKIDRVYKETDDSKLALINQIEELKAQNRRNLDKHREELVELTTAHSQELANMASEKDSIICRTQSSGNLS